MIFNELPSIIDREGFFMKNSLIKESNWQENILSIFKKMSNISSPKLLAQAINPAIIEKQKQALSFIKADMLNEYFSMVKNGYSQTEEEKNLINDKIYGLLEKNSYNSHFSKTLSIQEQLNDYVAHGLKLDHIFVKDFLIHDMIEDFKYPFRQLLSKKDEDFEGFLQRDIPPATIHKFSEGETSTRVYNQFKDFYKELRTVFLKPESQEIFKHIWQDVFFNPEKKITTKFRKNPLDMVDKISLIERLAYMMPKTVLKDIDLSQFMQCLEKWQSIGNKIKKTELNSNFFENKIYNFNSGINALKIIMKDHYKEKINHIIEETQDVFNENYMQKMTIQNSHEISDKISFKDLPPVAHEKINQLQTLYKVLKNRQLTEKDSFDLKNIMEKRIPETLNKYLSMDSQFRTELKNHQGKNAKDFMMETLTNFENRLNQIMEHNNENKLTDLQVMSQYSQKLKMN